ncbi:MAG: ABC transporter permease [Actinobacteria bacterium]|nr:ABC transporter permease [Actinomycetota bacterium]
MRPRWLWVHAALTYVFLFAPIAVLVVFSFNSARSGSRWKSASTTWYRALWRNADIQRAFGNTLKVGLVATAVATVIGTLAAFALSRYRFRGRLAYSTFIFVPLVIPEVVQGVSLLVFFLGVLRLQLGMRTLMLAHITFSISFVIVVVKARLAGFDRRLEEAAADLGATPAQSFLRVVLPLAAPGIAAGAVLAFTLSFDDVIISSFTAGVGSTTLPLYIYGQTKVGVKPTINALSTSILAFTSTLLVVGMALSRRAQRRGTSKGLDTTMFGG